MKGSPSKLEETPPVFQTWNAWYLAVIIVNILVVFCIYFFVSTL